MILHSLNQKHLKELFDIEFVASEIQVNKLRLDNLAFDEKNNRFVVIEYKNRFNANVLKQAQDYYDLVSDKPKEFSKRLKNPKNNDFDKPKVMIVSPKFSDKQIKEAKSDFELWQVSLYDDCCVKYEQVNGNKIKKLKVKKDDLKLTENDLLKNKSYVSELYPALKDCVEDKFDNAECKILVDEVSFKVNDKIICNIKFLKKSFNAHFHAMELIDEENKLRDISDISTGGKANYELKITSKSDLNYFMELFKQAYNQKVENNKK